MVPRVSLRVLLIHQMVERLPLGAKITVPGAARCCSGERVMGPYSVFMPVKHLPASHQCNIRLTGPFWPTAVKMDIWCSRVIRSDHSLRRLREIAGLPANHANERDR